MFFVCIYLNYFHYANKIGHHKLLYDTLDCQHGYLMTRCEARAIIYKWAEFIPGDTEFDIACHLITIVTYMRLLLIFISQ